MIYFIFYFLALVNQILEWESNYNVNATSPAFTVARLCATTSLAIYTDNIIYLLKINIALAFKNQNRSKPTQLNTINELNGSFTTSFILRLISRDLQHYKEIR